MGSKKIIVILLVLILCGGSAFVGYMAVKPKAAEFFVFDPGEYFVTNIIDNKSLLKSDIIIEMKDKKQFVVFEKDSFKIRDIIINVLRSKSYEEVKSPNIQNTLKAEIKDKINGKFNGDSIENIFFNEFVVQ